MAACSSPFNIECTAMAAVNRKHQDAACKAYTVIKRRTLHVGVLQEG